MPMVRTVRAKRNIAVSKDPMVQNFSIFELPNNCGGSPEPGRRRNLITAYVTRVLTKIKMTPSTPKTI